MNAAIVYNVWQYYQVTGDVTFLRRAGAEMVLEIARFWRASRPTTRSSSGSRSAA